MKTTHAFAFVLVLLASGCAHHQVTFDRPEPYTISGTQQDIGVIAVIDEGTLSNQVPIRSAMAGAAHSWEVAPGDMLKQVADIELPQMFTGYEFSTAYREPGHDSRWIVLQLAVAGYRFEDFRAKVSVTATAYQHGRRQILQKTYYAEGDTQGAKMFWGGAFAMKSALRQSSLSAYKQVFIELRRDLTQALQREH